MATWQTVMYELLTILSLCLLIAGFVMNSIPWWSIMAALGTFAEFSSFMKSRLHKTLYILSNIYKARSFTSHTSLVFLIATRDLSLSFGHQRSFPPPMIQGNLARFAIVLSSGALASLFLCLGLCGNGGRGDWEDGREHVCISGGN